MHTQLITDRIDSAIRFFLYVFIFWLPYSPAVVESCVVSALVLWIIKRSMLYASSEKPRHSLRARIWHRICAYKPKTSFLNFPIFIFLCTAALSVITSDYFSQSVHGFITKTLEWFVIYFLVIEVFTHRRYVYIAVAVFLFTTFSTALDGIIQFYFLKYDIFSHRALVFGRATAAFHHPNSLGGYLTVALPITASLLFAQIKKTYRIVLALIFFFGLWSLGLTFSRAAWFSAYIGILLCLFQSSKRVFLGVLVGTIAGIVCVVTVSSPAQKSTIRLTAGGIKKSIEWRVSVAVDSFSMIKKRPLTGHGLNTFMRVFENYRRRDPLLVESPTYAHNCYIQILAEMGMVGLAGFLLMISRFFRTVMPITKQQDSSSIEKTLRSLLRGCCLGAAAFLVHSFFDVNLYSLQLSALFWLIVGMTVSLYSLLKQLDICDTKRALCKEPVYG